MSQTLRPPEYISGNEQEGKAKIASLAAHTEFRVPRGQYQLYARDYPGAEPALLLMHGFPDNSHLYDRMIPLLTPRRRVITFDFLGWGRSDKPAGYAYTHDNLKGDLEAVIQYFKLQEIVLVAHDASGPPAIDWALANEQRIATLILLNTYYNPMPGLRMPEAIFLFSTPLLREIAIRLIASKLAQRLQIFQQVYRWQVGKQFMRDATTRERFIPLFIQQFLDEPSAREAFLRLNKDLRPALRARAARTGEVHKFSRPVRIIFGAADPYLNGKVARAFQQLFISSELFLLETVKHFPQLDEPEQVARLILEGPLATQVFTEK